MLCFHLQCGPLIVVVSLEDMGSADAGSITIFACIWQSWCVTRRYGLWRVITQRWWGLCAIFCTWQLLYFEPNIFPWTGSWLYLRFFLDVLNTPLMHDKGNNSQLQVYNRVGNIQWNNQDMWGKNTKQPSLTMSLCSRHCFFTNNYYISM